MSDIAKLVERLDEYFRTARLAPEDDWIALKAALESIEADAERWSFYEKNRGCIIDGIRLHDWLDDNSLRLGGVTAAIDAAMKEAGND